MLVTSQGKKQMCHAECIVLTNSQYDKLTCDELAKRVDNLAKDYHVDWAIDCNKNANIINITRTTTEVIDDAFCHQLEMDATNFMSAIDNMEMPKPEPECPSHESDGEEETTTKQFVEKLLHDLELPKEDADHVIGARILCIGPKSLPFPLPWGKLGHDMLQEMCKLYLAAHENN